MQFKGSLAGRRVYWDISWGKVRKENEKQKQKQKQKQVFCCTG